jgi:hypothetical protein
LKQTFECGVYQHLAKDILQLEKQCGKLKNLLELDRQLENLYNQLVKEQYPETEQPRDTKASIVLSETFV